MLLERSPQTDTGLALLGYGESSDAYHIATPRPDGAGAIQAMQQALQRAGLSAAQIDYINLHGTATPSNDRAEANAVAQLFGRETPASSTKGWMGHTLGAAGMTEAIIACLALERGFRPGTLNTELPDLELGMQIQQGGGAASLAHVLSNSFGFGGSNCSLIFGQTRC